MLTVQNLSNLFISSYPNYAYKSCILENVLAGTISFDNLVENQLFCPSIVVHNAHYESVQCYTAI